MGIVQRQGGKHSIIQVVGVLAGVLSTMFIYPRNTGLYGFAQFLASTAMLFMPLANLGIHALVVKYYPKFRDDEELAQSFFNYLLLSTIIAFVIFFGALVWLKEPIISWLSTLDFDQIDILDQYYVVLLIAIFLSTLVFIGRQQSMNFRRIVWPAIISEFSFKVFLPAMIVLSIYSLITEQQYAYIYIIYLSIIVLALWAYLMRLGAWSLKMKFKEIWNYVTKKELASYAVFSSLSKMGIMFIYKIDAFMITLMLGASSNGVFFIFLFLASVIHIPFKSINLIASPIISQAWEKRDFQELKNIYQKASLNLTILSFGIFLGIWAVLPTVIPLMPNSEELSIGLSFFLFLGLTKIVDSVTSVNEQILVFSPIYYLHVILIISLGALNVGLNYYLIGSMGLTGVALASLISFVLYNLIKMIIIYKMYDLQPFTTEWLKVVLLVAISWFTLYFVRQLDGMILRVLLIGMSLVILYLLPIVILRISDDFNKLIVNYLPPSISDRLKSGK